MTTPTAQLLTDAEIPALVRSQRKVLRSLERATPEQRAATYQEMGLHLTYRPDEAEPDMAVEVSACTGLHVGGGTPTRFGGFGPSPLDGEQG
jgi:hypothetical protein